MALILPDLQVLTQRLLAANGVKASLEEVTAKFEELYQGTDMVPGLCATERLIVPKVGHCTCLTNQAGTFEPMRTVAILNLDLVLAYPCSPGVSGRVSTRRACWRRSVGGARWVSRW